MVGRLVKSLIVIIIMSFLGCSYKTSHWNLNSEFVFPNSNIEVLGSVSACTPKKVTIFSPASLTFEELMELYNTSLSKKNGDILINCMIRTEIKMYPLLFIPIYSTKWTIQGTACKMTIGKQKLTRMKKKQIKYLFTVADLEIKKKLEKVKKK